MTKRKPSVPVTLAPRKMPVVYAFPCGCVATERRDNRTTRCDGTSCDYTPAKPPGTRSTTVRPRR